MSEPLFWLSMSLLLVAVSLTAVLIALLPAVQELARAARSAEKLFDTLLRDFPATLEAIRLTGIEISELTDDLDEGVKSAGEVVKQVERGMSGVRKQANNVQIGTKSVVAGMKAAWNQFNRPSSLSRASEHLPASRRSLLDQERDETLFPVDPE